MRLPLIPDISTKDGASNKNSRMFNVLAERRADGSGIASVRPGLNQYATVSGSGNGLVCFNGNLVSIFGANIGVPAGDVIQYTSNSYNLNDAILQGFAFLDKYVLVSEAEIYTTADFTSFTSYLGGDFFLSAGAANSSVAVVPYYDGGDDTYGVKVFNSSLTMTTYPQSFSIGGIVYGGGYFVGTNTNNKFCRSADGSTWTEGASIPAGLSTIYGLVWNGVKYCFVYKKSDGYLYVTTSNDGLTFSGETYILDTVAHPAATVNAADGWLIVIGDNFITRSGDSGETWAMSSPFPYDFDTRNYFFGGESGAVAYNSTTGMLAAVLDKNAYPSETHTVLFSTDLGLSWVPDSGTGTAYAAVVPTSAGFVLCKAGSESNPRATVLTGVGFGVTNIASINDSPTDFALIP